MINPAREGKANMLNKLYNQIRSDLQLDKDILIFTDANIFFAKETIMELVKFFKDERVGQVSAKVINRGMQAKGISMQENFYISRENDIKYHEGLLWGTVMGAFGACFAQRASLFRQIPKDHVVDDFFLTMKVLEEGKHCIVSPEAHCYEDIPDELGVEFRRKKRISVGNFQNLSEFKSSLFASRRGLAFSFWSHKVLRWLTPFFIITIAFCLIILFKEHKVYAWISYFFIATLFIILIDAILRKANVYFSLTRSISYFYTMNLALLMGFISWVKGEKKNIWDPTTRKKL